MSEPHMLEPEPPMDDEPDKTAEHNEESISLEPEALFRLPREEERPSTPPEINIREREWPWLLRWWAGLVTTMLLSVPILVVLSGREVLQLDTAVVNAYIGAMTGGTSILAIAGAILLKPFETLGR